MSWLIILTVVISLMVGGSCGLVIAAILITGKRADEQIEKLYKEKKVNE